MKKITQNHFSKRLAQYSALSVAIAGVVDANGQITYTDIPDFTGGLNESYFLDLNNDGTNDFEIWNFYSYYSNSLIYRNLYISPLAVSNEVLGSGGSIFAYPFALNNGQVISNSVNSWFNNGFSGVGGHQSLNYGNCAFGNWCDVTDKYLGLRFKIGGIFHYGWVRLDVDTNGDNWVVKDYAYNTVDNSAILAGDKTLSVNENTFGSKVKIITLNKSIALYNLPENTDYKLFSINGKSILKGNINGKTHVIEANMVATGVYILELTDTNNKAVIRKKIVL